MIFARPSRPSTRLSAPLAAALIALFASTSAHAGPPFQTDDPDPVAFRHFEMYAFELSDGTGKNAGGTALEVPAYEVNYGVVPNVQLHLVLPMTASFAPGNNSTNYGIGDSELGAKIRFIKETKRIPEIGIFPFFELPTGNADKGLGVGATWYRMPLWLQKSWGQQDRQWTSYGGGGEAIVPRPATRTTPSPAYSFSANSATSSPSARNSSATARREWWPPARAPAPCSTSAESMSSSPASTCSSPPDAASTDSLRPTPTSRSTGPGAPAARATKAIQPSQAAAQTPKCSLP